MGVIRLLAPPLLALPVPLSAQATAEYALKSSGSGVAARCCSDIAGCTVDANILSCLTHSYPQTTGIVIVVLVLFILYRLVGRSRGREV